MTNARSGLVDTSVSRWYHCTSRCVRQAFLLARGQSRKKWLRDRLREVSEVFAISVGGFSILDNHLHFLLRLDPDIAEKWSAEEVVTRWAKLHPPRQKRKAIPITEEWVAGQARDARRVQVLRNRLVNLGWFMKEIKEPLARMANKEDKKKGTFFEGRYKSIALLDEQSLLAVCAYIDLNPVAAGIAETPETSPFTSISERIEHIFANQEANIAQSTEVAPEVSRTWTELEDDLWLTPVENRQRMGSQREGMVEGFTLGNYLLLVEYTGRLHRPGKTPISPELEHMFERLGILPDSWEQQQFKLTGEELKGRFLSASRSKLRSAANQLGQHHCVNLNGCFAA